MTDSLVFTLSSFHIYNHIYQCIDRENMNKYTTVVSVGFRFVKVFHIFSVLFQLVVDFNTISSSVWLAMFSSSHLDLCRLFSLEGFQTIITKLPC